MRNIYTNIAFLSIILIAGCDAVTDKPNFILIMADDLGYSDIGCYGNTSTRTPNLDDLAARGVRFTDYHSSGAVCSPTRAALMTGRYQQRSGIEGVVTAARHRHTGLAVEEFTMAEYFREIGYKTGIIGKWHLGYDTAYSPVNQGFDFFKGYVSGNIDYHSHIDQAGYYDWWQNKDTVMEDGYVTDLITNASVGFIERNMGSPFFLYIAHEAPHYPYQGRNDPALRQVNGEFNNQGERMDKEDAYREMIEIMDEGIGRIRKCLEDCELLERTMILFCSDNGANRVGSNYPLKGFKASLWEGGHRVPAIAYWEGIIQPAIVDNTIMAMDIFPTFVDISGPATVNTYGFDGYSFAPLLHDNTINNSINGRLIFWRFGEMKAVRKGSWKLIVNNGDALLFNLDEDIGEQENLFYKNPKTGQELLEAINDWEWDMEKYILRTE